MSKSNFTYPPTIIIRSRKEKKHKCTIWPLKDRDDLILIHHPARYWPPLEEYFRLCEHGPPLTDADADRGIVLLDSSWRRVTGMLTDISHLPTRSLNGYQTAFPRTSRLGTDPDNGLASVEALYLAYRILERSTDGLLDHYLWANDFLQKNFP